MMIPRSMSMAPRVLLVFGSIVHLLFLAATIDALRPVEKSLFVVFGRPGSGKSTVANEAFGALSLLLKKNSSVKNTECIALDLDVCVTQPMRDNFGRGIYPTLEERKAFALDACDYVEDQLADVCERRKVDDDDDDASPVDTLCAIVSFSFVNTDLRDIFRSRFPNSEWVLIDTTEEECTKRINEREGHFYKGELSAEELPSTEEEANEESSATTRDDKDDDNSDWKFAPVAFPHVVLDGFDSVEDNAKKVVDKILEEVQPK